jgi:hypothetical protein
MGNFPLELFHGERHEWKIPKPFAMARFARMREKRYSPTIRSGRYSFPS